MKKNLVLILFLLISFSCTCQNSLSKIDRSIAKEFRHMDETNVMEFKDYDSLLPKVYGTGDFVDHVFMMPQKNTVGTNDIDNSIMTLSFKTDGELDKKIVKKDFLEEVTGSYIFRFVPPWGEEYIAYSQSRGFIIANVKTSKIEVFTVIPGLDGEIGNVVLIDGQTKTFLFEILMPWAKEMAEKKILRIISFDAGVMKLIAEHPAGLKKTSYTEPWFVFNGLIFIYNDSLTKLDAFDSNFRPATHPLSTAFNEHSKHFRRLLEIAVHPTLPYALIVETGKKPDRAKLDSIPSELFQKLGEPIMAEARRRTLFAFFWSELDSSKQFVPLVSSIGSIWNSYYPKNNFDEFVFSPDGKWIVFKDHTGNSNNPCFVAVPIDPQNPLYLGKPIKLGNVLRKEALGPVTTTWTTDPSAFVMTDGLLLYKWDLGLMDKMERVNMPEPIIPVPSETGKK